MRLVHFPGAGRERSLFLWLVVCGIPSVASSVVHVNIGYETPTSRTNLIIKDNLPHIFEKLGSLSTVMSEMSRLA
jgi:hypothetical protein